MIVALVVIAAVSSALATLAVRRHALRHSLLDIPNQRSSHAIPTPRGGGLGFLVVIVVFTLFFVLNDGLDLRVAGAIVFGAALLGGIGWADDRVDVHPTVRLLIQLIAAGVAASLLGGMPRIAAFGGTIELGRLGWPLAVLGLVWLTNLFNFMDGIDGIAASQGVVAAGFAALCLAYAGGYQLTSVAAIMSGALLGFLVWNWPPASIFMGDVGSGFIGFMLGVIGIASEAVGRPAVLGLLTLASPFIVDATITLLIRIYNRQAPWSAHRDHAYQRLARGAGSHGRVTMIYTGMALLAGVGTYGWLTRHPDAGWPFATAVATLSILYTAVRRMTTAR